MSSRQHECLAWHEGDHVWCTLPAGHEGPHGWDYAGGKRATRSVRDFDRALRNGGLPDLADRLRFAMGLED